jgi:hypothetical protein
MMRAMAIEPGIEINGTFVETFVEAFKVFPSVGLRRLVTNGIGTMNTKGQFVIDRLAWYPLENWLAAHNDIAESVGTRALFQVGQAVPKNAVLPPTVKDIHSSIAAADVGYHLAHRKNGKPMFDPATGQTATGIGSYGYRPIPGERRIVSVCENPYPCDFDRGILTALATRFERLARVQHDDSAPCRKKGATSCTYTISW